MAMPSVAGETSLEGLVDAPEHMEASQSVFWARAVAALTVLMAVLEPFKTMSRYDRLGTQNGAVTLIKVASVPFPSTSTVPVVSFERRTLLEEVELELERMEEPGGGNDPEILHSGAVSECMLYRGEYV